MTDQGKLIEYMEELKKIATLQQGKLTVQEVEHYLDGLDFRKEQISAVCQYLTEQGVRVEGFQAKAISVPETVDEVGEKNDENDLEKMTRMERNLHLYKREVSALSKKEDEQMQLLFSRFLNGEKQLKEEILKNYLQMVIEMAGTYEKRKISMDEIIAEGNLGLVSAMKELEENSMGYLLEGQIADMIKISEKIEKTVQFFMEQMIDELTDEKDWENTLVAKSNLLHEAEKYLSEENGRIPTEEELAEYTKISIEEIQDMKRLAKEKN